MVGQRAKYAESIIFIPNIASTATLAVTFS